MSSQQVLEVEMQRTWELTRRKPSDFNDFPCIADLRSGAIGVATHPQCDVVLADIGEHVIRNRDEFDV